MDLLKINFPLSLMDYLRIMKVLPHELDLLHWNSIIVIESLPESKKTGKELFDDKLARRCWQRNYQVAYVDIADKAMLFAVLTELQETVLEGRLPVLHFEMHGSADGLELKSDEVISWNELGPCFRAINTAMNNRLLVVLASCFGMEIGSQVVPMFRAPYRCIIAPAEKVATEIIEDGFDAFYEALPSGLPNAIRALNNYSEPVSFFYLDITEYFDFAWSYIRDEYNSLVKLNQLVDYWFEIKAINIDSGEDVVRHSIVTCLSDDDIDGSIKWEVYRYFMMAESFPDEGKDVFFFIS